MLKLLTSNSKWIVSLDKNVAIKPQENRLHFASSWAEFDPKFRARESVQVLSEKRIGI